MQICLFKIHSIPLGLKSFRLFKLFEPDKQARLFRHQRLLGELSCRSSLCRRSFRLSCGRHGLLRVHTALPSQTPRVMPRAERRTQLLGGSGLRELRLQLREQALGFLQLAPAQLCFRRSRLQAFGGFLEGFLRSQTKPLLLSCQLFEPAIGLFDLTAELHSQVIAVLLQMEQALEHLPAFTAFQR
ncbi:hypothetical protein D3C85_1131360 [compost metagenome]